jgi:hypothetical protein
MKITKDMKLGFSIETEASGTVLVYSSSISRDTFELYFAELGRVFADCYGNDDDGRHLALVGPQVAYASLKRAAASMGSWGGPSGVQAGLVNELIRRTQIGVAFESGWKQLPMATAQAREILDEDAAEEVLNSLVFFTAVCKAGPKKLASSLLPVVTESLGWDLGSWDFSGYVDSLKKSIADEDSTTEAQSVIA